MLQPFATLTLSFLIGLAVVGTMASPPVPSLAVLIQFNPEQLIQQYESYGLGWTGTYQAPTDGTISSGGQPLGPRAIIGPEIIRRGKAMVPLLIAFLEREVPMSRPANETNGVTLSFTSEILQMLVEIGDPRAVPPILKTLDGWDGKASREERLAALHALEKLTYVSFEKKNPLFSSCRYALEHPKAVATETYFLMDTPARLYHEWLAGEGRQPARWLKLARSRARSMMAAASIIDVGCAAEFLTDGAGRDDTEDRPPARLAEMIEKFEKGPGGPRSFLYEGKEISPGVLSWTSFLTRYGPRARPYADVLLRIRKELPTTLSQNLLGQLNRVGGPKIMAYLFEVLPELSSQVARIKADPTTPKSFPSDDPRLGLIVTHLVVESGIDRWTGRTFLTDTERLAWWEANKGKAPEKWLEANLDILVKQADERLPSAALVARQVLPDLPLGEDDRKYLPYEDSLRATNIIAGPFREQWLRDHRKQLKYDRKTGTFFLTTGAGRRYKLTGHG